MVSAEGHLIPTCEKDSRVVPIDIWEERGTRTIGFGPN